MLLSVKTCLSITFFWLAFRAHSLIHRVFIQHKLCARPPAQGLGHLMVVEGRQGGRESKSATNITTLTWQVL